VHNHLDALLMKQELVFTEHSMGSLGKLVDMHQRMLSLVWLHQSVYRYLLYTTEVCPLLSRDLSSILFALTRVLMKFFCSRSNDVINECRAVFNILPIKQQMQIRKVRFLQNVIDSDNTVCSLFVRDARSELLC